LHGGGILQYYLRGNVRSLFGGITLSLGEESSFSSLSSVKALRRYIKQKETKVTTFLFESSFLPKNPSFPLLSSVKDLETNQTEGNEGNENFFLR